MNAMQHAILAYGLSFAIIAIFVFSLWQGSRALRKQQQRQEPK